MKDIVRVAVIQPKPYPSFEDPRNLGHALMLLEKCRGEKPDIICFPEYFPFNGEEELAVAAKRLNAYIVAGLIELHGDKLYNTATLIDRSGNIVGRQRKRNLGVLERNQLGISPGGEIFRVFTTDFGKIGIPVCIDFWGRPEAGMQLADQGVEIVFNMAIFPMLRGHWKTASLVRAFEHFVAVVGVNTADYNALFNEKRVHQYGGGSFIIQPPRILDKDDFRRWIKSLDNIESWVTAELPELEQVHFADIDLTGVRRFRQEFRNRLGFNIK